MNDHERIKAYISSIVMASFTGFSFFAVKVGLLYAGPLEQMTYRYVFAAAASILVFLFAGKRLGLSLRPTPALLLTAASYVGFMGMQAVGLVYCTSIIASIIFACVPILIALAARLFLNEHVTGAQAAGIAVGAAAVIFIVLKSSSEFDFQWQGLVLMLLASCSLTAYSLLVRGKRDELHPLQVPIYCSVMGAIALVIICAVYCAVTGDTAAVFAPLHHPGFLLSTLYLGVCCILLSTLLAAYAAARLPAAQTSAFNNFSTVISIAAGALLLHEPLYPYPIIGSIVIIGSVIIVNTMRAQD